MGGYAIALLVFCSCCVLSVRAAQVRADYFSDNDTLSADYREVITHSVLDACIIQVLFDAARTATSQRTGVPCATYRDNAAPVDRCTQTLDHRQGEIGARRYCSVLSVHYRMHYITARVEQLKALPVPQDGRIKTIANEK